MRSVLPDSVVRLALVALAFTTVATASASAAEDADDGGMISLTKIDPTLTPVSNYTGDAWHRSTMFGDLGGVRQDLYEHGIAIDMAMTQVIQGSVSGDPANVAVRYNGLLDYGITIDSGRLGIWPGGLLVANAQTSWGKPLSTEPGNISPANFTALYPVPFNPQTELMEYYLVQGLPGEIVLIAGRVNATNFVDKSRFGNDPRNQFLNVSLNNDLLLGEFVSFSTYAALLAAPVPGVKNLTVAFAAFDPDTQPGDYGGVWQHYGLGVTVDYSWTIAGDLDGMINPIFLYTNKDALAIDNPWFVPGIIVGNPPLTSGNWGISVVTEQYLWKPDRGDAAESNVRTRSFDYQEPGVGFYFRFGYTPENRNPWNVMVGGGVSARGVFESRPYDRMGIGAYGLLESDDLQNQIIVGQIAGSEAGLELFYNFAVTPWLQVSADAQWLSSGAERGRDAFVVGTRLFAQF